MAGRIRDEDVKAVRDAVPIDVVVSEYLQLRNAGGGNLKGLCPFHDEKSPSFQVSPAKGLYYCFGCQEGGDTLDFVMKLEHITFAEAVERLAGQAGIALRYEEGGYTPGRQQGERTRLVEAHKAAAAWFAEQLSSPEAEIGRVFLAERGFDEAAAKHFGVGYAPAGWENLVRFLRGRGFSDKELLTSGLASEGRRGPMDRFRGRLIWPIRDITGEVIGFGARRLREDDNGPKYLNTPETPIYKKSHVLYGIDLAKKDIAKSGRAVVVEGYTDVMACHLAGVTTAIATCGTAFGEDHIKILRRMLMDTGEFRGEVVFTFDGDAAGQKAALKAFEDDQKFVARTFIAVGPNGMDPCELRVSEGDTAVRNLVDTRVPLFEFAIRSAVDRYDLETEEGRVAALDSAAPIVAKIKDTALRHSYAVRLGSMLGYLDERFVVGRIAQLARWERERRSRHGGDQRRGDGGRGAVQQHQRQQAPSPERGRGAIRLDLRNPVQMVERELLKLALQFPELVSPAFDAYGEDEFTAAPYAAVRRALAEAGGAAGADDGWLTRVREAAPDDVLRSLITELAVEPPRTRRQADAIYAGEQLVAVRLHAVDRRVAEVRAQLQRLGPRADAEQANAVAAELWALQQYGQSLREKGATAL
ncbi:DNA primase [Wenjunlia tyrosinilytica]|uniref:DNA primase n=1 Tax=Wenjunlia tyrosinilytica TaxID=1544741 RepID=A0A917ZD40_9ACTN|nr:DNA primase [Wenjunlia tyrosinilytica]GGO80618.1 DNA primase [Wenjunlia tyrosinilytica]